MRLKTLSITHGRKSIRSKPKILPVSWSAAAGLLRTKTKKAADHLRTVRKEWK